MHTKKPESDHRSVRSKPVHFKTHATKKLASGGEKAVRKSFSYLGADRLELWLVSTRQSLAGDENVAAAAAEPTNAELDPPRRFSILQTAAETRVALCISMGTTELPLAAAFPPLKQNGCWGAQSRAVERKGSLSVAAWPMVFCCSLSRAAHTNSLPCLSFERRGERGLEH